VLDFLNDEVRQESPVHDPGDFDDNAVLRELAKKCKTLDPSEAATIDPLDLDPSHTAYELDTEPRITIIPNFLNDEETAHIVELAQGRWAPSLVITAGANGQVKDLKQKGSSLRSSWSTLIDYAQTPMVADIERRLSKLAGIDVNYLERMALVRYEPGQEYKVHHDGIWRPATVFIYLNDVPVGKGGETFFPNLDVKIVPRKGTAIMWPNTDGKREFEDVRVMHAGLPPHAGVKYGVNCFFNQMPKRLMNEDGGAFAGQGPPEAVSDEVEPLPNDLSSPLGASPAPLSPSSSLPATTPASNTTPLPSDAQQQWPRAPNQRIVPPASCSRSSGAKAQAPGSKSRSYQFEDDQLSAMGLPVRRTLQ
jgi:prolyl 4-hydroxylase